MELKEYYQYFVSDEGAIYDNLLHTIPSYDSKGGYKCVCLCIDGVYTNFFIYKLVAKLFLGAEDVIMIDGDLSNSNLSNLKIVDHDTYLEWATPRLKAYERDSGAIDMYTKDDIYIRSFSDSHEAAQYLIDNNLNKKKNDIRTVARSIQMMCKYPEAHKSAMGFKWKRCNNEDTRNN